MAEYEFICESCSQSITFVQSMIDKLPDIVRCPQCKRELHQNYYPANIIFKGSWPGKDAKLDPAQVKIREADEKRFHEVEVAQKEADEVLAVRRKGRQAYNEFSQKHPQRIKRYNENMRKGIKGR